MQKHVAVIGAGFSGISAACELAKHGYKVSVFEKNESPGGRASAFSHSGFTFDMGPSWYWMPDVFEWFFENYSKKVSDYYHLIRLDPAYRIYFSVTDYIEIPADFTALCNLFESIEKGSAEELKKFLIDAKYKYDISMKDIVFNPCNSVFEFADWRLLKSAFKIQLFTSLRKDVYARFKNAKIRKILEFPAYFLGALPANTPALYSILNYADLVAGTWYPMGGMYKIVDAMVSVATELGVAFHFNAPVQKIITQKHKTTGIIVHGEALTFDGIIASADYQHVENKLLPNTQKNYNEKYWDKKTFAPSCLIFYLGIKGKINHLRHHNLFFDESFETFADEIYINPRWPSNPLFYVCCPSKTDSSVAPLADENVFILIPMAAGLKNDTEEIREVYFNATLSKLEKYTGSELKSRIIYKKSFAHSDFETRYNAYKGNGYGLANTLFQTAIFKPKMHHKKLKNMVYAGQLTVPGPGVPPSLISGHIAAKELLKKLKK